LRLSQLVVVLSGLAIGTADARPADGPGTTAIGGELRAWHKVTLTIDGPFAAESDVPSPCFDYALDVTFKHPSGLTYTVPGYFAADGQAADSGATAGTIWQAHLSPDLPGEWTYQVRFVKGTDAAVTGQGTPVAGIQGRTGTFRVEPTDKSGRDFRGRGRLQYVGEPYLKFAGSGEYFLKQGADAPENLLSYADFDGDFAHDGHKDQLVKTWAPHVGDWQPGDPSWQNGKGKGLIGALNYLASEGMNSISFLTLNIGGDDQNAFPYVSYDDYEHFDISRLAQWEVVFEHADRLGLFLHFKTQETENEMLLDNGEVGRQRSVYYRELVARFGHHLALNWNLGEENGALGQVNQSTEQRIAMTRWFEQHDPYRHLVVIHNGKSPADLLGDVSALTGYSLQTNRADFAEVHNQVVTWLRRSREAGRPWAVACDEPGDASHALVTDAEDPAHDNARRNALWGTLMAGGWGGEWYFGYQHPESDLTCQDWRSRDLWWDQCRVALEFFRDQQIPFWTMHEADALVGNPQHDAGTYAFAKDGELYLVFFVGGRCELDLSGVEGTFTVGWFNPRTGGELVKGEGVAGGGKVVLTPPREPEQDWLAVVRRQG